MYSMFDVFVYTLTLVDVVGGLPVTIWQHLSVLMYLCNKLVIHSCYSFCLLPLMLNDIRSFRNNIYESHTNTEILIKELFLFHLHPSKKSRPTGHSQKYRRLKKISSALKHNYTELGESKRLWINF